MNLKKIAISTIAACSLGFAVAPTTASAGSTVHVAGKAECRSVFGNLSARNVSIRLDSSGEVRSAGTNWLSNYGMDFSRTPGNGTWATATVSCSSMANRSSYTQRVFIKPDWRNHAEGVNLIG